MHCSPFVEEHFYFFPFTWLAGVKDPGELDTRDLLLAHTYDGEVVFPPEQGEQTWCQIDEQRRLRRLFTRQTFARHKKTLFYDRLRPYELPQRPSWMSATLHRAVHREIKYTITDWTLKTPGFYRPRAYLIQRWPAWLGHADLGSRAILIACLAALTEAGNRAGVMPTQVTCPWQAIYAFITTHFTGLATEHLVRAKLRKGIQELQMVGLLEEEAGAPLRYTFRPAGLLGRPVWSRPLLAQFCTLDATSDEAWLTLLSDLMTTCCEPVTRLATVWHTLRRYRTSPYLMDATDLGDLHKYIHRQRKQGPLLHHEQVLDGYIRWYEAHQPRLCSPVFELRATELALAKQTIEATPILMPASAVRGVDATQLWIHCERGGGLTVAEAQQILRHSHLFIWQEQAGVKPVIVPLFCPPPKPLSIDHGYIVRANDLHTQIDYSRPIEVWLKCDAPDARLKLRCCFRLLGAKERVAC